MPTTGLTSCETAPPEVCATCWWWDWLNDVCLCRTSPHYADYVAWATRCGKWELNKRDR